MPKITIDGQEITVEPGTTIMRAAERLGIFIPHYCYHRRLSVAGNCRMCLVEVETWPKLVTSCTTPVDKDGLVVHTSSDRVKHSQKAVLEFLLLNHPLDCPICDKAGECALQDLYFDFSRQDSRLGPEEKVRKPKNTDLGQQIVLDAERCILCTRCIRFMQEVARDPVLGLIERGNRTEITVFPDRRLDSRYSINTTDLCPVGALTSKEFRFKERVWFLDHTPSICPHCSTGCPVILDHRRRRIYRMMPGTREGEGTWLCDPGRLGYGLFNDPDRPQSPLIRGSDRSQQSPVDWDEALKQASSGLKDIMVKTGSSSVGGIFSNWCTNEEAFVFLRLFKAFGSVNVACFDPVQGLIDSGPADGILIRDDKNPNTRGVREIFASAKGRTKTLPDLIDGILSRKIRALYVVDPDLLGRTPDGKERKRLRDALKKVKLLVVQSPLTNETSRMAHVHLPGAAWSEKEGTFTNGDGLVQRIQQAFSPPGSGLTDLEIFRRVAKAMNLKEVSAKAADLFVELASTVGPFKGMRFQTKEQTLGRLKTPESGDPKSQTAPATPDLSR